MSLDHAILGFLQYRPLSGYDLKAVFDMSVRHFWPADQSQIYRTLARMAENKWTETEIVEQDDRPDRKVYHITDEGREELLRWLATPLPQKGERLANLIQVFFAGQMSDDEVMGLFSRLAEHYRQALAELRKVPEKAETYKHEQPPPARDWFFWMLTLECGVRMTEARLAWLEDVIDRLKRGEHLEGGHNEDTCS